MSVSVWTGPRAGVPNRFCAPEGDLGVFAAAIGPIGQAEAPGPGNGATAV